MQRKGSSKLNVQNSGLVVFLYDDANTKMLKQLKPTLVDGFDGERSIDDSLRLAALEGHLLAYELHQDDTIQVEVFVGEPEADQPPPQVGWLSLPSGKLRVEGYDSLRLGAERPTERGGTVTVAPGNYRVSIHRSIDSGGDLIALTPDASGADCRSEGLLLAGARDRPAFGGSWQDGVYHGRSVDAIAEFAALITDLTRQNATQLVRGMRLEVEVGGDTRTAYFAGGIDPYSALAPLVLGPTLMARHAEDPRLLCAFFADAHVGRDQPMLLHLAVPGQRLGHLDPSEAPDLLAAGWVHPGPDVPITVRIGAPAFDDPPADGPAGEATVLASSSCRLALEASAETLLAGAATGIFDLELGAQRRRLFVATVPFAELKACADALSAEKGEPLPQHRQRVPELQARRSLLHEERKALRKAEPNHPKIVEIAKEITALDRELKLIAIPEAVLGKMALQGWFQPHWDAPERQVLVCQPLIHDDVELPLGLETPAGTRARLHNIR